MLCPIAEVFESHPLPGTSSVEAKIEQCFVASALRKNLTFDSQVQNMIRICWRFVSEAHIVILLFAS